MATIQLYTTALERRATYDRIDIETVTKVTSPTWEQPTIKVRLDSVEDPPNDVTFARVARMDGCVVVVTSYRVDRIDRARSTTLLGHYSTRDRWTEYTLTLLSEDAAIIMDAVLAKPDPVFDSEIFINIAPSDLSSMLRRQWQLQAFAVKASRIQALETQSPSSAMAEGRGLRTSPGYRANVMVRSSTHRRRESIGGEVRPGRGVLQ